MFLPRVLLASSFALSLLSLTGCGVGGIAPTMLVQQDVNGVYAFTSGGLGAEGLKAVMLSGTFATALPKGNMGADYYSLSNASLVGASESPCPAASFQLKGKVTNPEGAVVQIDMTGTAPGGGTATLTGMVGQDAGGELGQRIDGTLSVTGSCAMDKVHFVAQRIASK